MVADCSVLCVCAMTEDDDERRRHIVRKKTARYLKKAEALHSQDLLGEDSKQRWQVWQTSLQSTCVVTIDCHFIGLVLATYYNKL